MRLGDLIQDDNGEVVLFNDFGLRALARGDGRRCRRRRLFGDSAVTAAGEDVSGFHYVTFDNGLTLYYQDGLEVVVRGEPADFDLRFRRGAKLPFRRKSTVG